MGEEELQFIDAETQFNNSKSNSIKEIVMTHISRIGTLCTKEFKEGYWEKRPVKLGDSIHIIEKYIEDSRDAYVNAVDFLHDILLAKFDDKATEEINKLNEEMKDKLNKIDDDNKWKTKRLEYRRQIFQQLNLLLKRLNYLDQGFIAD